MTSIRTLSGMICVTALASLACAQSAPAAPSAPSVTPPRIIKPAEAKAHQGETVTVCGKVVDSRKVGKYGLGGFGKPVSFDLDQPETNPVFYFVTFGVLPEGGHHVGAVAPADAQPSGGTPASGAQPPAGAAPAANAAPAAGTPPAAAPAPPSAAKPSGPEEVIAAYKDKRVCVTGKITGSAATGPFILQPDRSQIKIQEDTK